MQSSLQQYKTDGFFDEMFDAEGNLRPGYGAFKERIEQLPIDEMIRRQQAA
ncbi:MAG: circularly permuted type 2 ATP-grasp protein, partial [Sphingobacteriaceae bacterium]|nr:circularly permuted type 2 ATP-grasp protein [Cytophagaceae bacterium]